MSAEAREAWRTMTGEQYMQYLESLAANGPTFQVKSAEELFTDAARAAHGEELAPIRAAREARQRVENLHGEKAARAFDAFAVVEASEFAADSDDEEPNEQVRGLIPTVGTGLHPGPSSSLKSFAEHELAAAIHRGVSFHGRAVTKGRAVIVVAEGTRGYKRRQRAYAKRHGVSLADLPAVVPVAVNLFETGQVRALIEQIKLAGGATYVALDTKWRCSVGADENSANDQAVVLGAMDRIAKELNCFVMAVTHTGRDASKGARGSSAQYAAVDVELTQERTGDYCTLNVTKQKDNESGDALTFKAVRVDLGFNKHGEPESSLVLEPVDTADAALAFQPSGKIEKAVYDYVLKSGERQFAKEALIAEGMEASGSRRDNVRRAIEEKLIGTLFTADGDDLILRARVIRDNTGWLEHE